MAAPAYGYAVNPREELIPMLPGDLTSLLDVGCGRGGFGASVRRRCPGARLVGVEPDPTAATEARKHFDHVHEGGYPHAVPEGEQFDVVTFVDVLEHLADPWSALRDAGPHLNPGGVIVASIPNVRYWFVVADLALRGRWTYRDSGVLDRTHLRFFTRSSIEDLFTESGFVIDDMRGINRYRPRAVTRRVLARFMGDLRYPQFAVRARIDDRRVGSAPVQP